MKKLCFAAIAAILMLACTQNEKTEEGNSANNESADSLYQQNLATLKSLFTAFENEDIDTEGTYIADNAVWSSAAYGDTVETKQHWLEVNKATVDIFDNIHFVNGNYLPGVDSSTHEFDGSVRVYGNWTGMHTAGKEVDVKFYGTYEFDKDHKVVNASEYFDAGGMMNAMQAAGQ